MPFLTYRPGRWGVAWLFLCLVAPALLPALPVPIAPGSDVDRDPALLRLEDGGFLAVFTRIVPRQGNKTDLDLYYATAVSLDAALAGSWSPAQPVAPAANADVDEADPELVRLPSGLVGLFYSSDLSGLDQLYISTVSVPGDAWSVPSAPLNLREPAGTPLRAPSATVQDGNIILVYEAEAPGGPEIHRNISPNGITWSPPQPVAAAGRRPDVAFLESADQMVAFEDPANPRVLVTSSPTGQGGTWSNPQALPIPEGQEPAVLVHWDGRPTVYSSGFDLDTTRSLQRSFRSLGGAWQAPEVLQMQVGGALTSSPSPVVLEPGILCVAFDARTSLSDPPLDADVYFDCLTDFTCTEPPTFSGVQRVRDEDACALDALLVEWDPPIDYGSAQVAGARYYVYRGTSPFFEPTDIYAGPILTTFYRDRNVTPDVTYYYVVRAENLEECPASNGPRGGMMDLNTLRRSGVDATPAPPDGPVAGLRVARRALEGDLRLSWAPHPEAARYALYRLDGDRYEPGGLTALPDPPAGAEATLDPGPSRLSFFQVRAVSPCGLEGP